MQTSSRNRVRRAICMRALSLSDVFAEMSTNPPLPNGGDRVTVTMMRNVARRLTPFTKGVIDKNGRDMWIA